MKYIINNLVFLLVVFIDILFVSFDTYLYRKLHNIIINIIPSISPSQYPFYLKSPFNPKRYFHSSPLDINIIKNIKELENIFDIKINKRLIDNIIKYIQLKQKIQFSDKFNKKLENIEKIIRDKLTLLGINNIELFKTLINSKIDIDNVKNHPLFNEFISNIPYEFKDLKKTLILARYYILYIEKGFKFDFEYFNKKLKDSLDKGVFKEVIRQRKGSPTKIKKKLNNNNIYNIHVIDSLSYIIKDLELNMDKEILEISENIDKELLLIDQYIRENKLKNIIEDYKNLGIYKYTKNINFNMKILDYKMMVENIDNYINLNKNKLIQFNIESKLYKGINNILNNRNIGLKDKQIKIEEFLLMYEYNYINEHFKDYDLNLEIIYKYYDLYKKNFDNLINNYLINNYEKFNNSNNDTKIVISLLILLDFDLILNIFIKELINTLYNKELTKLTNLLFNVGKKLVNIYKYRLKNNILIDNHKFILDNIKNVDITDIIEIKLGQTIYELLNNNQWFEIINIKEKVDKTITIIKIKKEFMDKFKFDFIKDIHLPMIYEPNKDKFYLTPELNYNISILKNNIENVLKTELTDKNKDIINYINKQKFKINKDLLLIILKEWNNPDSKLFKGYNKLHPNTNKKRLKKTELLEIQEHNSKYFNYISIINISLLYKDYDFYLPCYYDFRGRIYTFNNYLTYQGNDLARGLILFTEGSKLNNINKNYLIYYLCNTIGLNKESLENKLLYYKNNEYKLLEYLNNNDYNNISLFKEPFQFLSIMISIINKEEYIYNPILFDATCNGLQHLSAMCSDIELAYNTNLLNNDKPQDFYEICTKHIIEKINNLDNEILKNKLLNININRSLIKKAIMTISYNITLLGLADDMEIYFNKKYIKDLNNYEYRIISNYSKNKNNLISLTNKEYIEFIKIIHNILYDYYPKLKILVNYFNDMINVFNKINKSFYWITPIGMKINHKYVKFINKKINTNILHSKYITISLPTTNINPIKQKLAFIPNMVHSLDATNIHLLILELIKYNIPIYTIHDCFASNLNNISTISNLVKLKFIEIYFDNNYLEILHNNLINQIEENYKIYNENNNLYIIHNNHKIIIPNKIYIDKDCFNKIKKELINSKYFIS